MTTRRHWSSTNNLCWTTLLAVAAIWNTLGAWAAAPADPDRPVRLVVGFPPGGGSDTVARIFAPRLAEAFGRPWVVDNRGGAAGNLATEIVAKSSPDGYTVLLVQGTSITVNPSLYKVSFNFERDLQPVILMAVAQYMLVTPASLKVSTLKDFVDLAKARTGKLNYGSAGTGGPHHLAAELFKARAGIEMTHVPYKGGGPASIAVLSGEVQALIGSMPSLLPHVKSGRLNALGMTGSVRSPAVPEVPTIAESGYPGFDVRSWFGLLVPAHTPDHIVKTIYETTLKILEMPDVKEAIRREGLEPASKDPRQLSADIKAETAMWATLIRNANIRVD